jgi:hypothetical protein
MIYIWPDAIRMKFLNNKKRPNFSTVKSLSGIERGALLLASVFILFGVYLAIWPTQMQISHPGSGRYQYILPQNPTAENATRTQVRVYGIISTALGIGTGWLALYRPRKKR